MKAKHLIILIPIVIGIVLLFNGCKQKGCTNKSALNYNITAQEDDGTCIYCTTTITPEGTISASLIDNNGSSVHYNQVVAIFNVSQLSKSFNYVSCGTDSCLLSVSIQNLVNQEIVFNYDLFTSTGDVFGFADIAANQTTRDSVIRSFSTANCTTLINASVSSSGTIVYH
jgi:hypothetical protein